MCESAEHEMLLPACPVTFIIAGKPEQADRLTGRPEMFATPRRWLPVYNSLSAAARRERFAARSPVISASRQDDSFRMTRES